MAARLNVENGAWCHSGQEGKTMQGRWKMDLSPGEKLQTCLRETSSATGFAGVLTSRLAPPPAKTVGLGPDASLTRTGRQKRDDDGRFHIACLLYGPCRRTSRAASSRHGPV